VAQASTSTHLGFGQLIKGALGQGPPHYVNLGTTEALMVP
jgi:hypothetical protein